MVNTERIQKAMTAITGQPTAQERNGRLVTTLSGVSNGAEETILSAAPYCVRVTITGTASILFHAWSCEAVKDKGNAAKGSAAKKTDNLESYVYRCDDGTIGIPGAYLIGSVIDKRNGAAKYRQDPRSPRKSALDLYKAGLVALTEIASLGVSDWDFVSRMRAVVQQSGITRERPALRAGWQATFDLMVLTPEYIRPGDVLEVLTQAGRLVGVGDFRPTYGRFQVTHFEVLHDTDDAS